MLPVKKKKNELTLMEASFLEALFGSSGGDIRSAMDTAGYSKTTPIAQIVRQLADEITEMAKLQLAAHSAKAISRLVRSLDDPSALGTGNLIKAANSLLDRAGLAKPESGDINLKVPEGGIVILPAKAPAAKPEDYITVEYSK